jgi:hypothetical protein
MGLLHCGGDRRRGGGGAVRNAVVPLSGPRGLNRTLSWPRRGGVPTPSASETQQRLARLKAEVAHDLARRPVTAARPAASRSGAEPRRWLARSARLALVATALVVLPFILLVRGSVWLYESERSPTWLALALAALATLLLVTAYGAWVTHRLTGRTRFRVVAKWVALPIVLGYTGHALLYLSRTHAKTEAVRQEYRATHPILRLALSTLILTSDDLVVTDLRRVPQTYARMGLPVNATSLHHRQADGWVHAVDVRTTGHTALRNRLLEGYFSLMGLRTLRHVGTADHLHVELALH